MAELTKTHELHKRRQGRNAAVGILLGLFVVLSIAVAVVKIGGQQQPVAEEASE